MLDIDDIQFAFMKVREPLTPLLLWDKCRS